MFTVYSKQNCPKCVELKTFLSTHNFPFEVIDLEQHPAARETLVSSGFRTVPQVFEGEIHIGDCDSTINMLKFVL